MSPVCVLLVLVRAALFALCGHPLFQVSGSPRNPLLFSQAASHKPRPPKGGSPPSAFVAVPDVSVSQEPVVYAATSSGMGPCEHLAREVR